MGLFDREEINDTTTQHPEQHPEQAAPEEAAQEQPPANEYWVQSNATAQSAQPVQPAQPAQAVPPAPQGQPEPQTQTTQYGYGQGYQQPYQPMPQDPYQGYAQGGYRPPQMPPQNQQQPYRGYQYNPNSGWQQPTGQQMQPRPQEQYQWNFADYDKAAPKKDKKKKNRGLVVFAVALACVLGLGLISVSAWGVVKYINDDGTATHFQSDDTASSVAEAAQLELTSKPQIAESIPIGGKMTIPEVYVAVSPSVVGVAQYQTDKSFMQTGAGSGIIMSADGYVITNAHVVAGGNAFKVVLHDGTPKDAKLIGADTLTDLAVLQIIDPENLVPAVFGDSEQIEVGETVITIGNPAGDILAGSLTRGVVSAVKRDIPTTHIPLIQTDAAINPGNSGGPLVNEYGQVIGINSAKIVHEEFEGIGFAIPISEAKPILDDIVTNGRVTGRAKLGITGDTIDEIDARNNNLMQGVIIDQIDPSSGLANTEVQRFDIITHIDGERVLDMYGLKEELEKRKPGDTVTLTFYRLVGTTRSTTFDVTVTLIEE